MHQRLTVLAQEIYECGAFKDRTHATAIDRNGQRGFRLKLHERLPDAPLSPFYLNLRQPPDGPLSDDMVQRCGLDLSWKSIEQNLDYHYVVGLPNAGQPFARHFPCERGLFGRRVTLLHLQKKMLPDGTRRICSPVTGGTALPGKKVLIIDDLITKADSKLEAIDVLEAEGFKVRDVLVIVDREQGGGEQLRKAGYHLHALFNITKLIDFYRTLNLISPELHRDIFQYLAANR